MSWAFPAIGSTSGRKPSRQNKGSGSFPEVSENAPDPFFLCTGHVMDRGTNLTYMQQRYYDPQVGRFNSVDPIISQPETPSIFSRYSYANNNPFRFFDPDGRAACAGPSGGYCVIPSQHQFDSGITSTLPDGAAAAIIQGASRFETRVPNNEKGGYAIATGDGKYAVFVQPGAETINHGRRVTNTTNIPGNSAAYVHSHSKTNMKLTSTPSSDSDGDAQTLLKQSMPTVTINRGRVIVIEAVDGVVQIRLLAGQFLDGEEAALQDNVDKYQEKMDKKRGGERTKYDGRPKSILEDL